MSFSWNKTWRNYKFAWNSRVGVTPTRSTGDLLIFWSRCVLQKVEWTLETLWDQRTIFWQFEQANDCVIGSDSPWCLWGESGQLWSCTNSSVNIFRTCASSKSQKYIGQAAFVHDKHRLSETSTFVRQKRRWLCGLQTDYIYSDEMKMMITKSSKDSALENPNVPPFTPQATYV